MNTNSIFFLAMLYLVSAFLYAYFGVKIIQKNKQFLLGAAVFFMYSFVFGFLPAIIYFRYSSGIDDQTHLDFSNSGVLKLYTLFFLSLFGFFALSLGYRLEKSKGTVCENRTNNTDVLLETDSNRVFFIGILFLIIGWVSLYLWTKAYGSISSFIEQASQIRSGRTNVENRFTVFKDFSKCVQFSYYSFLAIIVLQGTKKKSMLVYILIALAFIGSITYMLASDSRVSISYVLIASVCMWINAKIKTDQSILKHLLIIIIATMAIYLTIVFSGTWMENYRSGDGEAFNIDFFSSLAFEFRFTLQSEQMALATWLNGSMEYKFFDDFVNAVVAWIPSGLIFFTKPEQLWAYNTRLIAYHRGTMPTDLIAAGIYHIGIMGVVLLPFLIGYVVKNIDLWHIRTKSKVASQVIYYGMFPIMINSISHFQFKSLMTNLFPVFLYCVANKLLNSSHGSGDNGKSTKQKRQSN